MNRIFFAMVLIAFLSAGYSQWVWDAPGPVPPPTVEEPAPPLSDDPETAALQAEMEQLRARVAAIDRPPPPPPPRSPMEALTQGMIEAATNAVDLAISLIGVMTLFLGLMKVAEAGGLLSIIAKLVRPLMVRLFPEVPADHPAMGAMILNMSANALGLGNAATPFGIRAMQELDKLNPHKGTATDAMVLFLAINTSSVTLLPTGVIAIRATMGSADPAGILSTTLFATVFSTTAAITASKLYRRIVGPARPAADAPAPEPDAAEPAEPAEPAEERATSSAEDEAIGTDGSASYPLWVSVCALLGMVALIPLALLFGSEVSPWIVPLIAISLLTFGFVRGVPVYEAFVEGAKDGFQVAVRIIPYLVAILVAVAMLRVSGALDVFVNVISPITSSFGLPAEALPMALMRPLSGSGALGILMATMEQEGPDSYVGYLVSTLQGSTETTFYVLAVYFGAVQVQRIRHAMAAALTADLVGIIGAIVGVSLYFTYAGLW